MLDTAPCGYIAVSDDGLVSDINQTLTDLLGFNKADVIGKSFQALLTIASKIFYSTHLFPLLALHQRADEIFITLRGKDSNIPVLLNGKRTITGEDKRNEFILIPVPQRRKYEDEILEAKQFAEQMLKENRQLQTTTQELEDKTLELDFQYARLLAITREQQEYSRIFSHDVQEILHKLNVFTDRLAHEEPGLSIQGTKMVGRISHAVARAETLLKGLSQFINLHPAEATPVNLQEVIAAAKTNAETTTGFSDFTLRINVPVVEGNTEDLQLAFYHLILNAIQYRNPDRPLHINIDSVMIQDNRYRSNNNKYAYTDHVKIIFSDTGSGFDPKHTTQVFLLLNKLRPESSGSGIGLSLVKKIVENHSGSIQVSTALNEGTSFSIVLPVKQPGLS